MRSVLKELIDARKESVTFQFLGERGISHLLLPVSLQHLWVGGRGEEEVTITRACGGQRVPPFVLRVTPTSDPGVQLYRSWLQGDNSQKRVQTGCQVHSEVIDRGA